jgi:hypothetical protein
MLRRFRRDFFPRCSVDGWARLGLRGGLLGEGDEPDSCQ